MGTAARFRSEVDYRAASEEGEGERARAKRRGFSWKRSCSLLPLSLRHIFLQQQRFFPTNPPLSSSHKSICMAYDCMLNFDCINRINGDGTHGRKEGRKATAGNSVTAFIFISTGRCDATVAALSLSLSLSLDFGVGRRSNVFPSPSRLPF